MGSWSPEYSNECPCGLSIRWPGLAWSGILKALREQPGSAMQSKPRHLDRKADLINERIDRFPNERFPFLVDHLGILLL